MESKPTVMYMARKKNERIKNTLTSIEEEPALIDEQIAEGFAVVDNEDATLAKWLTERNNPTLGRRFYREGNKERAAGFKQLSKDLRLGNLPKNQVRMFDPGLLIEMTDVSRQCQRIGAGKFANFLIMLRDSALNMSASSGGFEIIQQNSSNVNINKALNEQKPANWSLLPKRRSDA